MAKRTKKPEPEIELEQPDTTMAALRAVQLLEQGETQQALRICIRALAEGQRNADLSNIAGACAAAFGDETLAAQLWQHALELDSTYAQSWFNLGLLHAKTGKLAEAEQEYMQAVAFAPGNIEAHIQLASLLINQGLHDQAEPLLRQALALDPDQPQAHNNLGLVLFNRRQYVEAEQHYLQALKANAQDVSALINLGVLCAANTRVVDADRYYQQALALEPNNAKALTNYGLLLWVSQRPQEAEQYQRQALAALPESEEILSNLANLLSSLRREDEAEVHLRMALEINPDSAAAHNNLGVLMANLRRDEEAEQQFNKAMLAKENYMLPKLDLGYLQLAQGRFAEGWRNYEARFDPRLPDNGIPLAPVSAPQWRGEDLNGKRLLIWGEQGFGDQILCSRYVPLLKQKWGKAHITLVCRATLKTLFQGLQGVDEVCGNSTELELPDHFDYWVMPFSIPLYYDAPDHIPANVPYLSADPARVKQWQSKLGKEKLKVGLVWRGNPRHHNDEWRSLPGPAWLSPLLEISGVSFISLQKDYDAALSRAFFQHPAVVDVGDALNDFADTAAVVSQLDLVIAVDTSVAHLAGALGKPCWVMLPYYRTDWRWQRGRDDTPWYPTLKLFRQGEDEEWQPVIQAIKKELEKLIKTKI